MAYRASNFFKGNAREPMPKAQVAGTTTEIVHTHTFNPDALLTADILELIPVPATARVTGITICSTNLPAGNLTMGWMSGEPGNPNGARTVGSEFVAAVAHATTDYNVPLSLIRAQGRAEGNRSIGVTTSADIAAAANRTLTIRITLAF